MDVLTAVSLSDANGVAHGFFARTGGVSEGAYASLNCGLGSNDDQERVAHNRALAAAHLGSTPDRLTTLWQVHSAVVVTVDRSWPHGERPKADAAVTATPGVMLAVLTADCAPVLFADAEAGVVGAAHAGWKGALDGVIEATVAAMEALGADRRRMCAAVGPCIGPRAYEVGPEFEHAFVTRSSEYARFFTRRTANARPYFDLPGFAAATLRAIGVGTVEDLGLCTYENESKFFSFRRATHRSEPDYGRQISAILRT